jgi:tRNA(Ile)-lysidine synthase
MRGTGIRGLCGIWPVSEVYGVEFVRPMLELRRTAIVEYCNENSIEWREDASNKNTSFARNKIRHRLLPVLESESDTIVDKLEKLSFQCQRFQLLTEKLAQSIINNGNFNLKSGCFSIDQKLLRESPAWVFYEVVRDVLVQLGVGLRRYTREHFDLIRQMINKKQGRLMLPDNSGVEIFGGELVFSKIIQVGQRGHSSSLFGLRRTSSLPSESDSIQLVPGDTVRFGLWEIALRRLKYSDESFKKFVKTKDLNVEWFDADKIEGMVEIRRRQDGDRFWPIGASGEKKVGRFLIDAQLNKKAKQEAVIIEDREKILWVAPIRMCEQAKITAQTKQVLEICVLRKESLDL